MFSSLRSRLLLTYALIIGLTLCVVGTALVLYILQNPAIDRVTYTRLGQAADRVIQRGVLAAASSDLNERLTRIDQQFDIRLLVISADGDVIADSRGPEHPQLNPNIRKTVQFQRGITLDDTKRAWLFVWRPLDDGGHLVAAAPRVGRVSVLFSEQLRNILRDDFLPPLIQAGLAALILALILAFLMSRWITTPLRDLANATQGVPVGEYQEALERGPEEVRTLARAFNRMVAQVRAGQQSQRDFVANVSHELKTPLTSIQGFAQAILDGTAGSPEELRQAGDVIYSEADRMHRLVLDLLDLARLDAGIAELKRSPVDLQSLLENTISKLAPLARRAQVSLALSGGPAPMIVGDGDRMAQVFTNLVGNAISHTPPGGRVTLTAHQTGESVEISVADTGVGIPPEDLSRIFERFYQVDKSRPGGEKRGTGLGLAIAKEIVQAHGGSITARSQSAQGSVFVVKIPLASSDDTTIVKRRS